MRSTATAASGEEMPDERLVELAAAGDERAFEAIYRRHARYVARVAHRLLGSWDEVEDVVQEVFIEASKGLATIRERGKLRAWLASLAVRTAHRRRARRRRIRWLGLAVADVSPHRGDPRDADRAHQLYDALDRIPDEMRTAWVLARVEGESLDDVAIALQCSVATVKRRLVDADERLKRRLDDV